MLVLGKIPSEEKYHYWYDYYHRLLKEKYSSNVVEASKTFMPAESIDYAGGPVVSKTILKKHTGNITLFAFVKGGGISEHSSPFEALIQLLEGNAEITIGGTLYILQTGQSIILPAKSLTP